jgi:hypothetical protein
VDNNIIVVEVIMMVGIIRVHVWKKSIKKNDGFSLIADIIFVIEIYCLYLTNNLFL